MNSAARTQGVRSLRLTGLCRKSTADRDAFQRYVCHTLKRMSCQTPVIVGDRKPSGGARGTPSRRQVTHFPYDPSFEMPDEGGPNERLTGTPSQASHAQPSTAGRVKPAQSPLSYSRGSFAIRSVPRVTSAPTFGDPSQLSGCPNGSISRWSATRGAAQTSDAP
jgi:hypothetical protein